MEASTIACNECGAPLRVSDSARFVTCEHCSSQLEIRRHEGAAWTEVVERLARGQEKLEKRVLRLEGDELRRRRPFRRRRPEEDATGPQLMEALIVIGLCAPFLALQAGTTAFVIVLCVEAVLVPGVALFLRARDKKREAARAERKRARRQARS